MSSELHRFLTRDHERLDALLQYTIATGDAASYDEFRRGLLRHISIEERVLFPLLRARRGVTEIEQQLHRDHAAISALLVPPPTPVELKQIASILESHNVFEEEAGGLYELMEELAGDELAEVMARAHAIPEVKTVANNDSPVVRSSIEQLLREADEGRRRLMAARRT